MPAASSRRKIIADLVRAALAPVIREQAVADLLLVLAQWESGTLHGLPPAVSAPDPARSLATHPPA